MGLCAECCGHVREEGINFREKDGKKVGDSSQRSRHLHLSLRDDCLYDMEKVTSG